MAAFFSSNDYFGISRKVLRRAMKKGVSSRANLGGGGCKANKDWETDIKSIQSRVGPCWKSWKKDVEGNERLALENDRCDEDRVHSTEIELLTLTTSAVKNWAAGNRDRDPGGGRAIGRQPHGLSLEDSSF